MHPTTATTLPLLLISLFVHQAVASSYLINNYCPTSVFLFQSNSTTAGSGPFVLPSGQALAKSIAGQGNVVSVTKESDFFTRDTGKLNLGSSVGQDGNLYWTLATQDQDPFGPAGQKVDVTSNGCGQATGPGPTVYNCRDGPGVVLVLNLCA